MGVFIGLAIMFLIFVFISANTKDEPKPVSTTKSKPEPQPEPETDTGPSVKKLLDLAIQRNLDIRIHYRKSSGQSSKRRLSDVKISNAFSAYGYRDAHIKGYCHLRGEERSFKISRIQDIELID